MKIRRPLFIIALSILVVIYAINTMPRSTILFSLALFALFVLIHKLTRNKYTGSLMLAFASALLGVLYFEAYNNVLQTDISELSAYDSVVVTGEITEKGESSATAWYIVDIDKING